MERFCSDDLLDQRAAGRAVFAGGMNGDYWDNVAIIILDVPTKSEAKGVGRRRPSGKGLRLSGAGAAVRYELG